MVGTVGGVLGQAGVNIAGMQVCRDHQGGHALVALSVDAAIPPRRSRRSASRSTRSRCGRSTSPRGCPDEAVQVGARGQVTRAGRPRLPGRSLGLSSQAAASRSTASVSVSGGWVNGSRTNRSSPPSGAKSGPAASRTPRFRRPSPARGHGARQLAPQAQPAGGHPEAPGRQLRRQRGDQRRPGGARAARRRTPSTSSRRAIRCTSASCSSTGAPRSRLSRAATSRGHPRLRRPHPADPQPAPERLARRTERHDVRGVRGERQRHRGLVDRHLGHRLVDDRQRAWPGAAPPPAAPAPSSAMSSPVGLWKSGMRYADRGRTCLTASTRLDGGPAALVDVGAHDAGAAAAQGRDRVRVGRALHQHPVADADEGAARRSPTPTGRRRSRAPGRRRSAVRARRTAGRSPRAARAARRVVAVLRQVAGSSASAAS